MMAAYLSYRTRVSMLARSSPDDLAWTLPNRESDSNLSLPPRATAFNTLSRDELAVFYPFCVRPAPLARNCVSSVSYPVIPYLSWRRAWKPQILHAKRRELTNLSCADWVWRLALQQRGQITVQSPPYLQYEKVAALSGSAIPR